MQIVAKLLSAALAMAALAAQSGTAGAQEPIQIGVLEPMTGPANKNGIENYTAMEIARDMIDERVEINGQKVEYLLADVPNPTAAISETERLITKDGVKITMGSGISPLAIAVSQTAERHGVFHWETAGAADIITKRGFDIRSRLVLLGYRYAQAAIDITMDELTKRLNKADWRSQRRLLCENRACEKSVGDGIRRLR